MGKEKKKANKSSRIAIVVSKFNEEISKGLLNGAVTVLEQSGIQDYKIVYCPGAFEIPLTALKLCRTKEYGAVVCLGAVIRGETAHFEFISSAVTSGIAKLNLEYGIPVTFGVLTCFTDEQAVKRSSNDEHNKGREAATAAMEMMKLLKEIK